MLSLSKVIVKEMLKNNCKTFSNVAGKMNEPVVTVAEGKVRGSVNKLYNGSSYYSFKGIPYAQPPVGQLRFKAPLPPKPWQGLRDAKKHGAICPQYHMMTRDIIEGNEDCLFLNVYTTSLEKGSKLPVIVFIHGGAYMSGSGDSDSFGPDYLIQHDVILVTFNYRLEVLGFLCLDTPEVPGNAGMKDQVAAMRWVKKNIAQFGGDPDNITLFGESVGGSSVTHHMISPMSEGLFNKAIAQSGVCTAEWSRGVGARERAFRTGKVLGKETQDENELFKFLQSLPSNKLVFHTMATATREEKLGEIPIHFVPVTEKKFDGIEQFLTEEPIDLILANKVQKVPILLGFNSNEGLMNLSPYVKKMDFYNKNPQYMVHRDIAMAVSPEERIEIGKKIVQFFSKSGTFTNDDIQSIADMCSDKVYVYNILRFAHYYSLMCKDIYLFRFDYSTELNLVKLMLGYSDFDGACHADDLFYTFSNKMTEDLYAENEKIRDTVYKITKLWADFAKTGNPTPAGCELQWPRYTNAHKHFLHLSERNCIQRDVYGDRTNFLNKLFCDAGLPCIPRSSL